MAKSPKTKKKTKTAQKGAQAKNRVETKAIQFDAGSDGAAVAKKIWRAGIGAYLSAVETQAANGAAATSVPSVNFGALVAQGKQAESKLLKALGSKKERARLSKELKRLLKPAKDSTAERLQEVSDAISATDVQQREKLEERMRRMRETLGLQHFETKPKKAEKLNSKLDELEEQVAALIASSEPITHDVQARVERLSREIADGAAEAPKPKRAAPKQPETDGLGRLASPIGEADDLTQINGVGPALQKRLTEAGIFHFWQIAALSDDQIVRLELDISFVGRIQTQDWRAQAGELLTS